MYEYTVRIYDNGFDKKSITCGLRRFDDVTNFYLKTEFAHLDPLLVVVDLCAPPPAAVSSGELRSVITRVIEEYRTGGIGGVWERCA